jgi:hypothetical protein
LSTDKAIAHNLELADGTGLGGLSRCGCCLTNGAAGDKEKREEKRGRRPSEHEEEKRRKIQRKIYKLKGEGRWE